MHERGERGVSYNSSMGMNVHVWDNAYCLGRRYADVGDYGRYVGELQCGEIKT